MWPIARCDLNIPKASPIGLSGALAKSQPAPVSPVREFHKFGASCTGHTGLRHLNLGFGKGINPPQTGATGYAARHQNAGPKPMSGNTPMTYRDAGVDIDAGNSLVERIKPAVRRTMRPEVLAGVGGFGASVRVP